MKINNNVDSNYTFILFAYFLSCLSFSVSTLIVGCSTEKLGFIIFLTIINLIILYFIFNRYYIFDNKEIKIKVGPIIKKIKYKEIKKAYITNHFGINYSTSERCICIETKTKKFYISPKKMDEILMFLIKNRGGKRC